MRDMSDHQMEGCAGGPLLMSEALMEKEKDEYVVKQQKRSRQRLLEALLKASVKTLPLLTGCCIEVAHCCICQAMHALEWCMAYQHAQV